MTNLTIQVEDNFFTRIESKAKDLKLNTDELVIKALEYFLYIEKLHLLRQKLEIYAQLNGFSSEEDFYKQIFSLQLAQKHTQKQ